MTTKNRREYLTATTLDQDFLDRAHEALVNKLEMIADIQTPTGFIRASDRNKYVGTTFYEARLTFPTISRTLGLWLSNELEFSTISLELSNVDKEFSDFLPGGDSFAGWVGKTVEIKLGLRDQATTYKTIFKGFITDVGGFGRSQKTINIVARDQYDSVNRSFPVTVFTEASYPKADESILGKNIPIIYGNWTTAYEPYEAAIPAIIVNSADPDVDWEKTRDFTVSTPVIGNPLVFNMPRHLFGSNDKVKVSNSGGALPSPLVDSLPYYVIPTSATTFSLSVSAGPGAAITWDGVTVPTGTHRIKSDAAARSNLQMVISSTTLVSLDTQNIYLRRNDVFYRVPSSEIFNVSGGNNSFEVRQSDDMDPENPPDPTTPLWVGADGAYVYQSGDEFFVRVKGKSLSEGSDNIIAIAKDILKTYGGLTNSDFDASWDSFRLLSSSDAARDVAGTKCRAWVQDAQEALSYANSLLEQVRLEIFVERTNLKFAINSVHLEDFSPTPTLTVRNWDLVEGSLKMNIDDRNNFNRAIGEFSFLPIQDSNGRQTRVFKNQKAIDQIGKAISKKVVFPNLYSTTSVEAQLKEILRISSSYLEIVECSLTWRAMLKDLGDFVGMLIDIGATAFDDTPMMIRDIGYNPNGLSIPVTLWSTQMLPFPGSSKEAPSLAASNNGGAIQFAGTHSFVDGESVIFTTTGTLPTGLALGTVYFVRDVAVGTFKVSSTVGGSAITYTDSGAGTHAAKFVYPGTVGGSTAHIEED